MEDQRRRRGNRGPPAVAPRLDGEEGRRRRRQRLFLRRRRRRRRRQLLPAARENAFARGAGATPCIYLSIEERVSRFWHEKSTLEVGRFVTVTLTEQSSLPSADGQVRLEKLLETEPEDFSVNWENSIGPAGRKGLSAPGKFVKHQESSGNKSSEKQVSFAERPVSFVKSGTMADSLTEAIAVDSSGGDNSCVKAAETRLLRGAHQGFGSKMMAKMGFIEGTGLGKDGQGIVQPIQAIHRPKSLGLGVQFDSEAEAIKARTEPIKSILEPGKVRTELRRNVWAPETSGVCSFERHTKGFGSKMMVKMGFVPGSGLGKDGQGIATPLTAAHAIMLEQEHYLGHFKDHPKDAEFLNCPIRFYTEMEAIFANAMATGKFALGSAAGPKRKRGNFSEEEMLMLTNMSDAVNNVANALRETGPAHVDANLYLAVMEMPGFSEEALIVAYTFLLDNMAQGRGFVNMSNAHRALWLRTFLAKNYYV
ncbi:unnamed protein product [Miscanthus lutarioriparius]|uniref:G-patch domain-containing protein n=1 Tax=Miscanthus lutarioriparius TaxID=422564 RepID=A0A811PC31_9POAL|nr:unnamed protein product [Miscanthus lutarioriparius]